MRKAIVFISMLLLPFCVGLVAGALTQNAQEAFGMYNKPPLSPPAWLFPVAWTILYILMGIASYLVYVNTSSSETVGTKILALLFYAVQLFFNFLWSLVFFRLEEYWVAFVWLLILWVLVFIMMILYRKISALAFWLTIPYLGWLTFAAYLNLGVAMLN